MYDLGASLARECKKQKGLLCLYDISVLLYCTLPPLFMKEIFDPDDTEGILEFNQKYADDKYRCFQVVLND